MSAWRDGWGWFYAQRNQGRVAVFDLKSFHIAFEPIAREFNMRRHISIPNVKAHCADGATESQLFG